MIKSSLENSTVTPRDLHKHGIVDFLFFFIVLWVGALEFWLSRDLRRLTTFFL